MRYAAIALLLTLAACSSGVAASRERAALGEEPVLEQAAAVPAAAGAEAADSDLTSFDRMVTRTAELSLLADDTETAYREITQVVGRFGGFLASAHLDRGDDDRPVAFLTIRVPAVRMDALLDEIESIADEVSSRTLGSADVTAEYTDLESRLRNLEALEAQLLDLMAEVREQPGTDADDLLAVFNRIGSVREEIELLQGRKQLLEDQVELATITVSLSPTPVAAPLATEWKPVAVAKEAIRSLVGALQGIGTALIWFGIFALPTAILLAIPGGLGLMVFRRLRRREPSVSA